MLTKHLFVGFSIISVLILAGCRPSIKPGPEFSHYAKQPSAYRFVEVMSGKPNLERLRLLKNTLDHANIAYLEQPFVRGKAKGHNVIVDYGEKAPTLLIAAHFDRVEGSPGANDNASCIASALSAYQMLQKTAPLKTIKLRLLFTDKEENGLWGAEAYVKKYGVKDIIGMVSFDLCGIGDALAIWDLRPDLQSSMILKALRHAADQEKTYYGTIGKIPRYSSDHRAFYKNRVAAVGVTIAPKADEALLREYIAAPDAFKWWWVSNRPKIFQSYHNEDDLPETIDPKVLTLTARIIFRLAKEFDQLNAARLK